MKTLLLHKCSRKRIRVENKTYFAINVEDLTHFQEDQIKQIYRKFLSVIVRTIWIGNDKNKRRKQTANIRENNNKLLQSDCKRNLYFGESKEIVGDSFIVGFIKARILRCLGHVEQMEVIREWRKEDYIVPERKEDRESSELWFKTKMETIEWVKTKNGKQWRIIAEEGKAHPELWRRRIK